MYSTEAGMLSGIPGNNVNYVAGRIVRAVIRDC